MADRGYYEVTGTGGEGMVVKPLEFVERAQVVDEALRAAQVAHRIGIAAPAAFDINTACTSFLYGLSTATALVHTGAPRSRACAAAAGRSSCRLTSCRIGKRFVAICSMADS